MADRLLVIDGNSLMFRAYYALPALTAPDGTPTGAVYGFLSMLLKAIEDYKPTHAAVAFDLHGPTVRHQQYEAYKAGRKPTPEDLIPQFSLIKEALRAMEVPVLESQGFEADDILGTLSWCMEQEGNGMALLVTGDRDALQLIGPHTRVLLTQKGISQIREMDEAALWQEYELKPEQIPDLKGLMGDASDNLPGIPGIGEKTALVLLHQYGSVEGVLSHAQDLKGKQREKVMEGAQSARQSRDLAVILRDVPLTVHGQDCLLRPPAQTALPAFLERLALGTILKKVQSMAEKPAEEPKREVAVRIIPLDTQKAVMARVEKWLQAQRVAVFWADEFLAVSDGEDEYRIPLQKDLISTGLTPEDALVCLAPLWNAPVKKVLYDAKEWMHRLTGLGLFWQGFDDDVMIAGWLLNAGDGGVTPAELFARYLGGESDPAPAAALLRLWDVQRDLLAQQGMKKLYRDMEQPLTEVLWRMEHTGFPVDERVLRELGGQMDARIGALVTHIHELAGGPFNINSTKQLGEVLFDKLGLPVQKKKKTGYSTDIEVLEALEKQHEIIPLIMEYRQLTKLKGTYVEGLLALIQPRTGRLHTRFLQTGTATGRLSSAEPNLQNIPVRMPEGRLIRRAFISGGEGRVLVDADYSQIELRILAHMAEDPKMIEAFLSGADIHRRTASQVFGVPQDQVTDAMRSGAKAVNFGIIYGISDFGLARQLGISRVEAGDYIKKYLDTFQGVRAFMEQILEQGKQKGYVTTLFGRRRETGGLRSRVYQVRSGAERMAMNAPLQGTAADIIKMAMVAVDRSLREWNLGAQLLLQVHDELIVDAPRESVPQVEALLRKAMEGVISLKVPLTVDIRSAASWYDTK